MKRHKSLHPLSHDHQHALAQARRLRQAGDGATPLIELSQQLLRFWDEELSRHFRLEEEVLLPTFARFSDARRPEISETLLQHVDLRRRIQEIANALGSGGAPDASALVAFGQALHEHIRYEEDVVFPAIEAALGEQELQRLAPLLRPAQEN